LSEIKIPTPILLKIGELVKHELNVKEHPVQQINNLMKLIQMVGFKDPIVIDKDNIIWAGHGRLEAAYRLDMELVPCIYLEDLSESQKKLFMYMDNQINESPWVMDNVKILLGEIPQIELEEFQVDFNDILGITLDENDEIPDVPAEPKSKLGEVYQMGNHRVICGDCTNKESVSILLEDSTVDSLQTDPPYGIEYGNKNAELNKNLGGNRIEKPLANDSTIQDYKKFAKSFLEIIPFSKYNTIYFWMSNLRSNEILDAVKECQIKYHQTLIWIKNNHVLGRLDHNPKHELCFYGWKGQHKFYGGFKTDILEYDKPLANKLHPTMKPPEMIAELIIESTKKDMIVYDPFLGSGSTLIACEQTNRICYGMEIDPGYIDVIITRWQNFTGKKAELIKLSKHV